MKKIGALTLAILLVLTQCFAFAEEINEAPTEYTQLIVGNPTPMQGKFFTDLWGKATSDEDVRTLIHGYDLIRWDGMEGMFTEDMSVVSGMVALENEAGDRSFMFVLQNDLFYSDGTHITAQDYAFSILLQISPVIAELGGVPSKKDYLLGYEAYMNGTVPYLAGVRVVSDDTLMITLDHEYLPFFYEIGLLMCAPYPIHVIAPGLEVRDDGNGAYLTGALSAAQLQQTVMDPSTGYLSHPSVSSGPYTLTSWDGVTAVMDINPYYKGNYAGLKPSIPTLIYTHVDNENMAAKLENGEVDLLNKVMRADNIQQGMDLVGTEEYQVSNYPRAGLSYLSFCCEKKTVASEAVRQAIAWCMDRDQIVAEYTGNYGLRIDGYFGIGQWMYGILQGTIAPPVEAPENERDTAAMKEYEDELAAFAELTLDNLTYYTVDVEEAKRLLEEDGWKLNAEGIREKEIEGEKITLDLTLIYAENNAIGESFERSFLPNLQEAGIRLTLKAVPMKDVLAEYYQQGERDADMIYLASNFDMIFDPSINFIVGENDVPSWAFTKHSDEELYNLALAMRETEPGEVLEYCQKWLAFQERFNQTLPVLPIYTNVYFDFYTRVLRDYLIEENTTWGDAVIGAYMSDEEPEEELLEEGIVEFE